MFWAFFIGFAIKVPMFPFHTWLPDAHVEAPTAGSVILAGVLLKMGTYGFLRFSLPLLPQASADRTIVHDPRGAVDHRHYLRRAGQPDADRTGRSWWRTRRSATSGFCTLGIFALNQAGIAGSIIQQVNHGISTGMLFLIVGIIYERRHTREIKEYGGLAHVMPNFAFVFAIAMLELGGAAAAERIRRRVHDPAGRIRGESRSGRHFAVLGVIFGAAYLLWLYQRTMLGEVTNEKNEKLPDLSLREWAYMLPLMIWAVAIGVYPKPYFDILEKPVAADRGARACPHDAVRAAIPAVVKAPASTEAAQ